MAVTELVDRLRVIEAPDAGIGPVKQRNQGLTAGEFLAATACCQLTGGGFLVVLDRARADRVRDLEAWPRGRTDIEDRISDAKHAALRHLPSGDPDVNAAWMGAALL